MRDKIPVTAIVATLNEEKNLPRCLAALERFDEVIIVDSSTNDAAGAIAHAFGAKFVPFAWNGRYPKKRQWCLDNLSLKYDRIFFVDADEEVTAALCDEIAALDWACAGYFVKGAYVVDGKTLRFGLKNNKLCLFDRRMIEFPVVDDLGVAGMGEMEGHYQPVLKKGAAVSRVGRLKQALRHHALEDIDRWDARHTDYAIWQRGVERGRLLPGDPFLIRRCFKTIFARIPARAGAAFLHSYILKAGFLDGQSGKKLALSRKKYYEKISC